MNNTTHPFKDLKAIRERAGWTLDQVAVHAGIVASTVSRIENGYVRTVKNRKKREGLLRVMAQMRRAQP